MLRNFVFKTFRSQLRSFSTTTSSTGPAAEHTLPVKLFGIHARYANALYLAASKAGQLENVDNDVMILSHWQQQDKFAQYLKNPVISRADKIEDIRKISAGMSVTTSGFLSLLAENGRLMDLKGIIDTFNMLMEAKDGTVQATAVVAQELNNALKNALYACIRKGYVDEDQNLDLNIVVDPTIVGGVQLQIGSRFVDLSIQSEIKNLKTALLSQSASN